MGERWHVSEEGGPLPPGLYCEDKAAFDAFVADPSIETATVPAGGASPLPHGLQVFIATSAEAAILRAMPARTGATQPDWQTIRSSAERFLLDFCQPRAWDPPPLRVRRIGVPEPARRPLTSVLSAGELAALLANPGEPLTSGLALAPAPGCHQGEEGRMSDPMLPWQGKVTAFELDQAKGTWTLSFDLDEPSSHQFEESLSKPSAEAASGRLTDAYGDRFFEVGDLVTRDGTDVHRVVSHNGSDGHAPDGMTVVCVKAPASGWTDVGKKELNVCSRYEWVDPVDSRTNDPLWDAKVPCLGNLEY